MKSLVSSALVAIALVSSAAAVPSPLAGSLQRRTDAPPLPPCTSYTPFAYLGCFVETSPESLQYNPNLAFSTMTVEICTATCKSNGYRYAGLIYYGNCLCGTMLPTPAPEGDCNAPCNGNPNEICGQNRRMSVWQDPTYPAVDLSTIASEYVHLGCYAEPSSFRALAFLQNQLSTLTLTTEKCLAACGNEGYPMAGTEFSGECYCGTMLTVGTVKAPASDCNMPCTGDSTEICGGRSRLNIYEAKILESTETCTTVSSSTTSTISTVPTVASSTTSTVASSTTSTALTATTTASTTTTPTTSSTTTSSITTTSNAPSTTTAAATTSATPGSSTCGGTAYGYSPGLSKTFVSLGIGNNWGWVITGTPPISGILYMGAGGNDISKATNVGSLTIARVGSNLVVTYTTTGPYTLSSTHFYYGTTPPSKVAPGQFGNTHDPLPPGAHTDTFTLPYNAAKTTFIVHAGINSAC